MKDIELNKGNESSRFPVLKSQKVGDCFIRVTLDTRHASREGKLPVAICFHQQGKKWYYHLDMKLTGDEFVNVCKATGRGRVPTNLSEIGRMISNSNLRQSLISIIVWWNH